MALDSYDRLRLTDNAKTAIDALDEGVVCSLMIIATHNDGHGYRLWSGGDEKVNDQIRHALMQKIPLSTPKISKMREEPDGA